MEIQKFKYLEKKNYFLDEIKNISVVFEVFCSLQLQISACFMRLSPRRQWNRKLNLFISVWISLTLAIILLPFRLTNGHFRRFNSSLWLFCDKVHEHFYIYSLALLVKYYVHCFTLRIFSTRLYIPYYFPLQYQQCLPFI